MGDVPNAKDWIEFVRDRRAKLTNADEIAMVDMFIEHLVAEYVHDVPAAIGTMHPEGTSRHWGGGPMVESLPAELPNSARGEFYGQMVELGGYNALKFVALDTDRFIVGEDGIFTDGVLWNTVTGRELDLWGGGPLPDGCSEDDTFQIGRRLAIVMSFRDGRIVGEDLYWDGPATVLRPDHVPEMPATP